MLYLLGHKLEHAAHFRHQRQRLNLTNSPIAEGFRTSANTKRDNDLQLRRSAYQQPENSRHEM